jgi:hypothetical protein
MLLDAATPETADVAPGSNNAHTTTKINRDFQLCANVSSFEIDL